MLEPLYGVDQETVLAAEVQSLLADLGKGRVDGVAYDTAWAARLAPRYPGHGFDASLEWLRRNQYDDGTWGAPLVHYHDRFISTLAAIVALREVGGDSRDERRVKRGEDALWRLVGRLGRDDSDTVGFPILSASLAEEARSLGLDVPNAPVRYAAAYKRKVNALLSQPKRQWRANTITFSLEALRTAVGSKDDVLEVNNSVCISPSATAGYLMMYQNESALSYLVNMAQDGAVPGFDAIDIFEILWSLSPLQASGAIEPDMPEVRRLLDRLWQAWSPEIGISYSTHFPITDIDDTAACIALLRWGGYPIEPDAFTYFEMEDHFCTYHSETNPSPSSHLRVLWALRWCEDHPQYQQWTEKALNALYKLDENGSFWWDKWHASPYYVSKLAVAALQNIDAELANSRIKWIIRTQNDDGGWGYMGESTAEETAYCLDALLEWNQAVESIDSSILDEAAAFLKNASSMTHFTPLWISKGLYTPHNIVRSTILSAMYKFNIQFANGVID